MNLKIPDTASGRVIPHSVQKQILKEEEDKSTHKKQRQHETFRFWFALIFSNSISLAALIIAILAYLKQ